MKDDINQITILIQKQIDTMQGSLTINRNEIYDIKLKQELLSQTVENLIDNHEEESKGRWAIAVAVVTGIFGLLGSGIALFLRK